jgi:hypothetical protein
MFARTNIQFNNTILTVHYQEKIWNKKNDLKTWQTKIV